MSSVKKLLKKCKYVLNFLPDPTYIQLYYFIKFGRFCNFKNPQTFNEKLQWLKLYDRNPLYTTLVDKVEVKKFVADIIGEEYIIPTLGVWDNPDEINFNDLPNQFVLKCNHDSGEVFICRDKDSFEKEQVINKIKELLKQDFYLIGREWPYKNVVRKVFAEKYMVNETTDNISELSDYKYVCFNGKVKCVFTCTERYSKEGLKVTSFDRNWNVLPFERKYPKSNIVIKKPINHEKMIELAEKLSENIPFVRVDFYESNGRIYFGELTFYPGCGFEKFSPKEWDVTLGEWLHLPNGEC